MMKKVKVTRKFQVTIPVDVLRSIGVEMGEELLVEGEWKRIVMEKATSIEGLAGAWTHIEGTRGFKQEVRKLGRTWKPRSWRPRS